MFDIKQYDGEKEPALPWSMRWPKKASYNILSAMQIHDARIKSRKVACENGKRSLTDEDKYSGDDLYPPFESYIVPNLKDNIEVEPSNPLMQYQTMPYPKEPEYIELVKLDLNKHDNILEFVNRNGLLGIIFHNFFNIGFDYVDISKDFKEVEDTQDNNNNEDGDGEWQGYPTENITFSFSNPESLVHSHEFIVEPGLANDFWFCEDGIREGADTFPITTKTLNDIFFPFTLDLDDTPDTYISAFIEVAQINKLEDINLPKIWLDLYSEPLELFRTEAIKFKQTYKSSVLMNEAVSESKRTRHRSHFFSSVGYNMRKIQPKPIYDVKNDKILFGWKVPSLLSAYYLMLYLDITGKRNARFCANEKCGTPFIAVNKGNIYHNNLCREATNQRKKRDRKKES